MARRIALVAAPRARRGGILQARDQFDPSPLFRRARDYCERAGLEWFILSAMHGLLAPSQVIGDERYAVHALDVEERAHWAADVASQLDSLTRGTAQAVMFELLAGQRYADLLTRAAPQLPLATPLAGLDFVARLRWFDARLQVRSRLLAPKGQDPGQGSG